MTEEGWEVRHWVRVGISRTHGQASSTPWFIPSKAKAERLLISSQGKGCQPWLIPSHCIGMVFQAHHLVIYVCERKQGACMLQKKVAKFEKSIISCETSTISWCLSTPANLPLQRPDPKTIITCVPSAKHFSHPKIRFLDVWKKMKKSRFKHSFYKLDLSISFCCLHRDPIL